MKKLAFAFASLALISAPALAATNSAKPKAAQCRDTKGKFIKCPPKTAPKKVACRDAKGKFIKCKA